MATEEELTTELAARDKQLADQATALQEAQAAIAEGARKEAFREAGFADHPARELLEKAYEVGMTAEQLTEMAQKFGIASTVQNVKAQELDALRRTQSATGTPTGGSVPEFGDAIANARSLRELEQIVREGGEDAGIQWRGKIV